MKRSIIITLWLSVLLALTGCKTDSVSVTKPAQATAFVVCLDVSDSVKPERFAAMRDRMIPELVLSRVKQGDTVHFLECGENSAETARLFISNDGSAKLKLPSRLREFYDNTIKTTQTRRTHATDLRGPLAYAERLCQTEAQTQKPHRVEVLIFTDGLPEGTQTAMAGQLPEAVNVGFWGIDTDNEAKLAAWAKSQNLADGHYQIVLFSQWQNAAAAYEKRIARTANPNAVKALAQTRIHESS